MVTDSMIEAIKMFNRRQNGSEAAINVLIKFLMDWNQDEWENFTTDEKMVVIDEYVCNLYF